MFNDEQKKKILGEYYIDTNKEKNKLKYIETINNFINLDNTYLPFIDIKSRVKYYNSNVITFIKQRPQLKLLDIYQLTMFVDSKIKDGFSYTMNDCFICYNTDNDKKIIYVKRGIYGDIKEMSASLGVLTLKTLYKAFVYDVLSYKILNRSKKEFYKMYNNLMTSNLLYGDNNLERYYKFDYVKHMDGIIDKNNIYNLFDNTMKFQWIKYNNKFEKSTCVKYLNSFQEIKNFFKDLQKYTKIEDKEGLENYMKNMIDKKIEKLIQEKENCLSVINDNNIF